MNNLSASFIARLVSLLALIVFVVAAFSGDLFGWDLELIPLGLALYVGADLAGSVLGDD